VTEFGPHPAARLWDSAVRRPARVSRLHVGHVRRGGWKCAGVCPFFSTLIRPLSAPAHGAPSAVRAG